MTKSDWLDLTVLERQKYNHLSELMDLFRCESWSPCETTRWWAWRS